MGFSKNDLVKNTREIKRSGLNFNIGTGTPGRIDKVHEGLVDVEFTTYGSKKLVRDVDPSVLTPLKR